MTSVNYSDLLKNQFAQLSIPKFHGDETNLECAYAYIACGWWILPVRHGSKKPGSILGDRWPEKSSNQKAQAELWFKDYPDRGIALHTGRSGALVADVDNPDQVSLSMRKALDESNAPYQATRLDVQGRGHYVFALPAGVRFTNSPGSLGSSWGEIRTGNSVVIVEPSIHEKADLGGCYKWQGCGEVPLLPEVISTKLRKTTAEYGNGVEKLDNSVLEAYVTSMNELQAPGLLELRLQQALPSFRSGSRHNALTKFLLYGFLDSRAGLYPAIEMISAALEVFTKFKPRDEWSSPNEFWDLVTWTAAASKQVSKEVIDQTRETGLALIRPGVRAWLKAVSNVN